MVVSTRCRACGSHIEVVDGKGVPRKQSPTRIATRRTDQEDPSPPSPAAPPPKAPTRTAPHPKISLLRRLLGSGSPLREVPCFRCQSPVRVIPDAQSSQCPKCGGYVNLADYQITESWHRRIETRGNVTVTRTGSTHGFDIRCHNLTLAGVIHGAAECSGDLVVEPGGRITGRVSCRRLMVRKRAKTDFPLPVTAASAVIAGEVRGMILCSGPLELKRNARLSGPVRTSSLVTHPHASHTGMVEIITPSPHPTSPDAFP